MAPQRLTTRRVAQVLHDGGFSVVVGTPPNDDLSNVWVVGEHGTAVALHCQAFSVMANSPGVPDCERVRDDLVKRVCAVLDPAGIRYERSAESPSQLLLGGF